MFDIIDRTTLKPRDVVGVRVKTQIGWGFFRYPKTITRETCKAKINRLRISINEVMFRIEKKCTSCYRYEQEGWE